MLPYLSRYKKIFSDRAFTGGLIFVVFLYIFEELFFDFPQLSLFQIILTFRPFDEVFIAIVSGLASFLFCYFFVTAALTSNSIFRWVYIFFVALSSLVQYGFWKAVDRFMSSADLEIANATPFDTWQGAGALFFDWRFIIPVLVFFALLIIFGEKKDWKRSLKKFAVLLAYTVLVGFLYTLTNSTIVMGPSLSSFYQTIADFSISGMFPSKRENIKNESIASPKNNIVLVIDESIRGDHLSINGYSRPTTPFLDNLDPGDNIIYNFGIAVSGGTCSHTSNALILTGVRPGIDDFELTESYPTVFQYASSMGYATYYMDAQTNSFWNGLTDQDVIYLGSWIKAEDLGDDLNSDFYAAEKIVQIVSNGAGNFIVLNKRGVHFLYEGSYPPDAEIWGPVPGEYTSQPDLVINPYDNGVRYNVNTFFERLLSDPEILVNTAIIYTSDHGQTLFENNASWAHCNFTPQEAIVPLIVFGMNLPSMDTSIHASHSSILPTLLDLMNVPDDWRTHKYAPSLFSAKALVDQEHYFFDGALRLVKFPDP